MRVLDLSFYVLEECLRAAQTLVISQAATFASHIAAILVVLIESWWKPYQKLFWVGTVVVSPPMASGEMALFLLQNVSGRGADARIGFAMFWMYLCYSPLGVTSFVSLYHPLGCPLCS